MVVMAMVVFGHAKSSASTARRNALFVQAMICRDDPTEPVSAKLNSLADTKDRPGPIVASAAASQSSHLASIMFDVPAGHYVLRLATSHCSSSQSVTVLPGHSRHVAALVSRIMSATDSMRSLTGTIPSFVQRIEIVGQNGHVFAIGMVDSGAYYFENVGTGLYTLRVLLPDALVADFPADISGGSAGVNRLDISVDELYARAGALTLNNRVLPIFASGESPM